jgi:acetylornithine deacetylase/succinyl-diaminopimelate desuccinylase family protein
VPVSARDVLARMLRIPSVTGAEGELARALGGWCREAGLEVELDEVQPGRPNVLARWRGGGGPSLVLTGHLDTVAVGEDWTCDPFGGEVARGRMHGRGACDMKGGLAAAAAALLNLRAAGAVPAGDVTLAAVVGEEEDSAGTRHLVERGLQADLAVLAEPTGLHLVTGNRGLLNYRLVVKGEPAHASEPALGRNAVVAAAGIVLELEALGHELAARSHPRFGPPSLTVGTIQGGTRPYVVPERCQIEVDRRLNPDESRESARAQIEGAVRRAGERGPQVEVEVLDGPDYLAFEVPEDHEAVRRTAAALERAGVPLRLSAWRAASDAGFLVQRLGIPCLLFGPGSVEQAHRPDEWVPLAELEAAQRVFENLITGS